jgi:cyclopropane-fatty-acyl-phospholipid synthase
MQIRARRRQLPEFVTTTRDRVARSAMFKVLSRVKGGRVTLRESEGATTFGSPGGDGLDVVVEVHSNHFYTAFFRGSLGLAESYRDREWDCDDLVGLTRIGARNMPFFDRMRAHYRVAEGPARAIGRLLHDPHIHKTRTARHYNAGNELFELFLDETMAYSCGDFEDPARTMYEASTQKFDRVCRTLKLSPDDHVIEIGTGWGGFAAHAAGEYGCRVTSATISHEQLAYAQRRIAHAGVADRVELVEQDFASLDGRYDKLVSVEMIETIGWRRFDEFFETCGRLLKSGGEMLMQAITIADDAYEVEKLSKSFINTLIFEQGSLPSNRYIADAIARLTDMRIVGHTDMTEWYPLTLSSWREAFNAQREQIEALGYDDGFRRVWDLYLAYCEGGFLERRIMVGQTHLAKPLARLGAVLDPGRAAAVPQPV